MITLLLLTELIGIVVIPFLNFNKNKYIQVFLQFINVVVFLYLFKSLKTNGPYYGTYFTLDSLNIVLIGIVSVVGFLTYLYSIGYLEKEKSLKESKIKEFYLWINTFMFSMLLLVSTSNLGIMWVSIEATTLSTTFLISFYKNKTAVEASWKYIMLCSLGIALALFGIILIYFGVINIIGGGLYSLDWQNIMPIADKIDKNLLKIAFVFVLVGFGTKMGLAPLHFWLPDAHSEAPTPISALMSSVLLSCSFYTIIRIFSIESKAGIGAFTYDTMLYIGLFSIVLASIFIPRSRDYKRLLAYSTMEHMGILAFSLGLGSFEGIFASLLGLIAHALTKALMFMSSGSILVNLHTKSIKDIKGLFKILPITATFLAVGVFAITGAPPFLLFISEFLTLISAFKEGFIWQGIVVLLALSLIFFGFIESFFGMLTREPTFEQKKEHMFMLIPMGILVILIVGLGLFIPNDIKSLLENAVYTIGVRR
ncbi:NADH dehydrogenase (quinone) [Hydrogenobaculum sp. Y04AAS1]|uniref:proton-conducting transporter transmembrane domain-containing protein n=1 Tax=Hydrogenobaculum sp. (strain Y04AAS1) TaxID=380749 RepID=UPI00015BC868|nr:NADH dehydrogenase (quinone) [Hydrogenobaculum sp. Y04AAS1]HCT66014.1 hydrogenase 4 subunit F [Hydrogenobaculum sp.]